MAYAILLSSNVFIGTDGVLSVQVPPAPPKEFFKIQGVENHRQLSSRLVVDCDIRDETGAREVGLRKSRIVSKELLAEGYKFNSDRTHVEVLRPDGSVVIRIEQLSTESVLALLEKRFNERPTLFDSPEQLRGVLQRVSEIEAGIRITGSFVVAGISLRITESELGVNTNTIANGLKMGGGGIHLTPNGFAF